MRPQVLQQKKLILTMLSILLLLLICYYGIGRTGISWELVVEEPGEDLILYRFRAAPGSIFMLQYRHSVSNSLVEGLFLLTEEGYITPLTTTYTSFGPGLPMEQFERYTIEEGRIVVSHSAESREELRLWVSPLTKETLIFDKKEYPLHIFSTEPKLITIQVHRNKVLKAWWRKLHGQLGRCKDKIKCPDSAPDVRYLQ